MTESVLPAPIQEPVSVDDNGSTLSIDDGGGIITVDGAVTISGAVDTELPSAAAAADGFANPTAPGVLAHGMVWNGATWDRASGDTEGATVQGGKGHDAAVGGENPFVIAGRASAAAPADVSADNDVARIWSLRNGSPVVNLASGGTLITGDGTNGLDVDVTRVGGNVTVVQSTPASLMAEVVGDAAHDAAVAGNPVLGGAYAETPDDSAPGNQVSAEADVVRMVADRDGAIYTHPHPPRIWHASNEYTSAQTDVSVKGAPGSGLSLYITDIFFAANGAVTVTLEEDTDVLKWRYYASAAGDGASVHLITPIKLTANKALEVTTSAAVTCFLMVSGYTAP